ncbi:MAG TPA: hypothetical protein VF352_09675 [Anaerolineales bacterium]
MNPKSSTSLTAWLPVAVLLTALLACNASQAGPSVTQLSGQNILPTAVSGQNNPPTAVSGQNNPPTAVSGQNDTPTSGQSQPANTETPTSTPIVHNLIPGEPPAGALSEITDRNSSEYAAQHRTNGGENFGANLYERPFNANTMDKYFPDLDIIRARLMRDDRWVFVSIYLVGPNPAGGMRGDYGLNWI